MPLLLKAFLAFLIASSIAWVELVTSKYPRTIELFWKPCKSLWIYAAVYGLISFGFTMAYGPLHKAGILQFQAPTEATGAAQAPATGAAASPVEASLLIAIMIGLSAKALLHIRFFSIPTTGTQQTFPVGTETIVQLFEPWLLRTIAIDEFNAVSRYLTKRAGDYSDLALEVVQAKVKDNLPAPGSLPDAERAALVLDIDKASNVRAALEIYLRAFGVATVNQLFPPRS